MVCGLQDETLVPRTGFNFLAIEVNWSSLQNQFLPDSRILLCLEKLVKCSMGNLLIMSIENIFLVRGLG